MRNQDKKLQPMRFHLFFHRLKSLVSYKRRNEKIHQEETMRILNRIQEIKTKHPELTKYLNEMPEFQPDVNDSEIKLADLIKYNNSLMELLKKYESESNKKPGSGEPTAG